MGERQSDGQSSAVAYDHLGFEEDALQALPLEAEQSTALVHAKLPPLREFRIRWPVVIVYGLVHLGALAAIWNFSWEAFWVGFVIFNITGCVGISAGYHRLFSHNSFQTYHFVRWFHALSGICALQLGPITWVRLHRIHHARTDTDEDPHTQKYGFLYGYAGWVFLSHKTIGRSPLKKSLKMTEMKSDPVLVWMDKNSLLIYGLSLLALFALGGWSYLFVAGFARTVILTHLTWLVNTWSHEWGSRRFETQDFSQNNPVVGILAWGEGWHNNHHFIPSSAAFGLKWYEIDLAYYWIRALEVLGLAWNVKTPSRLAPPPSP